MPRKIGNSQFWREIYLILIWSFTGKVGGGVLYQKGVANVADWSLSAWWPRGYLYGDIKIDSQLFTWIFTNAIIENKLESKVKMSSLFIRKTDLFGKGEDIGL